MPLLELTLAEAAKVMRPPITERQLREIVNALCIPANGTRRLGGRGRPHATYDATSLLKLHAAIAPWLDRTPNAPR